MAGLGQKICPTTKSWPFPPADTADSSRGFHSPGDGQLSAILAQLSDAGRDAVRRPHPEILNILDPRPLLDDAAALAARYGGGLLIAETLAAGLIHGRTLYFGAAANVGRHLAQAADDLAIAVHVIT